MKIVVVPATYNRPDALAALFEGYLAQTWRDFEIVVADDGSGDATRETVERYRRRARFRIGHVWQENRGYRAAAIRNQAVAASDAEYVVYTDHDCVPRPDFLERHARLAERGWFVAGNRVLLSAELTQRVLAEALPLHRWTPRDWWRAWRAGGINRLAPLVRLPDGPWRKLHPRRWQGAKTCNLAVWRRDLDTVDGMDEAFTGWGLEDSDLVIRLIRAGVFHKSGRFACPLFHLWHREQDRGAYAANRRRIDEMQASGRIAATVGLSRHLR